MKKTIREKLLLKYKNRMKRYPKRKVLILIQQYVVLFFFDVVLFLFNRKAKLSLITSCLLIFTIISSFSYATKEKVIDSINLSQDMQIALESTDIELDSEVVGVEDIVFSDYDIEGELPQNEIEDIVLSASEYDIDNFMLHSNLELDDQDYHLEDWNLMLTNKQHPIPDGYEVILGEAIGGMECDERIINDLLTLMKAANDEGVSLIVCSAYRSYEHQERLFYAKINKYVKNGMTYIEAYKKAGETVTVPGTSEHQLGLAIDFITANYTKLNAGFGKTEAGIWLEENCANYGFILRYPQGKEYITGIHYEPWHFRYVGVKAATEIMEGELTLEEFLEEIE